MSNKIGVYNKSHENATLIKFKYSLQPTHSSIYAISIMRVKNMSNGKAAFRHHTLEDFLHTSASKVLRPTWFYALNTSLMINYGISSD